LLSWAAQQDVTAARPNTKANCFPDVNFIPVSSLRR
jgi:hypothetical protein